MAGLIYVLVNPAMPGLVKIGQTTHSAKTRADELSRHTGVPDRFAVVHEVPVSDPETAEKHIHHYLAACRYRKCREFFEMSVADAISAVNCCTEALDPPAADTLSGSHLAPDAVAASTAESIPMLRQFLVCEVDYGWPPPAEYGQHSQVVAAYTEDEAIARFKAFVIGKDIKFKVDILFNRYFDSELQTLGILSEKEMLVSGDNDEAYVYDRDNGIIGEKAVHRIQAFLLGQKALARRASRLPLDDEFELRLHMMNYYFFQNPRFIHAFAQLFILGDDDLEYADEVEGARQVIEKFQIPDEVFGYLALFDNRLTDIGVMELPPLLAVPA